MTPESIIKAASQGFPRPHEEQGGYILQADSNGEQAVWSDSLVDPLESTFHYRPLPSLSVAHVMDTGNSWAAFDSSLAHPLVLKNNAYTKIRYQFIYSAGGSYTTLYYREGYATFLRVNDDATLHGALVDYGTVDDIGAFTTNLATNTVPYPLITVTSSNPTDVVGRIRMWREVESQTQ